MKKNEVYPSVQELMPDVLLAKIPQTLAINIEERYKTLGTKYLTEHKTEDGRLINSCMFGNSIQEALEEVVDAVFNILVLLFKHSQRNDHEIPNYTYDVLTGLIEIYTVLYTMHDIDKAA